jgi:hypothetical protein
MVGWATTWLAEMSVPRRTDIILLERRGDDGKIEGVYKN